MADNLDNELKLYIALVEQLQKYNGPIWQLPTALLAANAFALNNLRTLPVFILGLSILNAALIYAFYKMVVRQKEIINVAQKAEVELSAYYPAFIPTFKPSKVPATCVMVATLIVLDLCIVIYSAVSIIYLV